jgi:hypothetical protein
MVVVKLGRPIVDDRMYRSRQQFDESEYEIIDELSDDELNTLTSRNHSPVSRYVIEQGSVVAKLKNSDCDEFDDDGDKYVHYRRRQTKPEKHRLVRQRQSVRQVKPQRSGGFL